MNTAEFNFADAFRVIYFETLIRALRIRKAQIIEKSNVMEKRKE